MMPIIWCSISAHGFGHAAQVIPILNELGKTLENVHVVLRTSVSSSIFKEYLQVEWEQQAVQQDVGCVQRGPLDIDIPGTMVAYEQFHLNWEQRVAVEVTAMNQVQPDLVISNVSYLAIASAVEAHYPVVAIASLSWDQVLQGLMVHPTKEIQALVKFIRPYYRRARHLIRLGPAISMPAFPSFTDTGPSFPLSESLSGDVRKYLKIEQDTHLVLLAFGGVPLTALPFAQMEACKGFHFLVVGQLPEISSGQIYRVEDIPLPFGEILKQVDVVMTKPGYATITAAVHYGIPLVYVRRHNFVDEEPLVEYVHSYGRALELGFEEFRDGVWEKTLQAVLQLPMPGKRPPQPDSGAVAKLLESFLQK